LGLITDVFTPDCLQGTFEEMAKLRRESLTEEKKILFDKLLKKKNLKQED
jgi:peptide deformylase